MKLIQPIRPRPHPLLLKPSGACLCSYALEPAEPSTRLGNAQKVSGFHGSHRRRKNEALLRGKKSASLKVSVCLWCRFMRLLQGTRERSAPYTRDQ